jgi:outer membrane protein, heavy metal efflux system
MYKWIRMLCLCSMAAGAATGRVHAQGTMGPQLDSLVASAIAQQPALAAAVRRAEALRLRVTPAGTLPDPMMGVGIMNMPIRNPGFKEEMTMATLMVSQAVTSSGRLRYERAAALAEAEAAEASAEAEKLRLRANVGEAYYELVFAERASEILIKSQTLLNGVHATAESRYAAGLGTQHDVLRTRLDLSGLAERGVVLAETRRARTSQLNALVYRPLESVVDAPAVADRIIRLAVAADAAQISFVSSSLGARVANSTIPPLEVLQRRATARNPQLRQMNAMIEVAKARERIAARATAPDIEIALQYGMRPGMSDMVSLTLSAPIPIRRKHAQDPLAAAAGTELAAVTAERDALLASIHAQVSTLHAQIEQTRSQLALYRKAILPQGSAAVESALTAFSAGKSDLGAVLDAAAALLAYEESYHRLLSDFAMRMLQLDAVVGEEVLS